MEIITLTKESYFNDIEIDFPIAYEVFQDWIDNYKALINWVDLFGEAKSVSVTGLRMAPKFHEVPFELQRGIMSQFFFEHNLAAFTAPHQTEAYGFEGVVVDFRNQKAVYQTFTDTTYNTVKNYSNERLCAMDTFTYAFDILNRILIELHGTDKKS